MDQMRKTDNLSHFKKIAIEGEMALACSSCVTDEELLSRFYRLLRSAPKDLEGYISELFREMFLGDQSKLDRVLLEVCNKSFPKWLWLDKSVADIKLCTSMSEQESSSRVKVNRREAKKKIIRSAFVNFCRAITEVSMSLAIDFCSAVEEETELTFLHDICFSFRSELSTARETKIAEGNFKEEELEDDLFELEFNIKDILSFTIETKALDKLMLWDDLRSMSEQGEGTPIKFAKDPEELFDTLRELLFSPREERTKLKSKEGLSNLMSQGISKMDITEEKRPVKVQYQVEKEFLGTDIKTVLKVFDSEKDAHSFVKSIEEKFPELLNTCKYTIVAKKVR